MGATYEIRAEEAASYPWVDFEGEVTAEGVLRAIDDLCEDGVYEQRSRLWDFRGCDITLSAEDLQTIAQYGAARDRNPGRVALLTDTDLGFGLSRMYEAVRDTRLSAYRAFRDEEEALAWLAATGAGPA